jgi:long-chain acyl-CoA synthetase
MACRILHQLAHHAAHRPAAPAIIEPIEGGERALDWASLFGATRDVARRVAAATRPGQAVMLVCSNRAEFFPAFLGTLLADRVVLPLSPRLTSHERDPVLDAARPALRIACSGDPAAIGAPILPLESIRWDAAASDPSLDDHRGDGELWLMSSGTTGSPKIVRRTARALDAVAEQCVQAIGYTPDDVLLAVTPLHHSYTIDHALAASMLSGAAVRLAPEFDPAAVWSASRSGRVTILAGTPFLYEALLELHAGASTGSIPNLRTAITAGSPLPESIFNEFHRRFGLPLAPLYGATEFGSVTFADPRLPGFDPASVGRPMPGVRLRLDPVEGDLHAGQIAVAAPSMLSGYVGQSGSPLIDGWFASGDLGRLDAAGNVRLTGRLNLLIDVRGMKVNPLEVEAVLRDHPAVDQAVVVPLPVTAAAGRLKAIVTARPGEAIDEADLLAFARRRLSGHKVPRHVEVRPSLPRSPTGKVLRRELT